MTRDASTSAQQAGPLVELLQLPASVIDSLADGELAIANRRLASEGLAGSAWTMTNLAAAENVRGSRATADAFSLTPYLVAPESRRTWRVRSEQIARDPSSAAWITRVVYDRHRRCVVGKAGYHGPPDESGMVEIGYAIDPLVRRRGYARAAVEVLLDNARRSAEISRVRASISPGNSASLNLVAQFGFVEVGEQEDEEDGLEIVYEVDA
jgi:RimJ/RimL family protein N-acetyltransferase